MSNLGPVSLAPADLRPHPVFRAGLAALETASILRSWQRGSLRMLDIGGGHGIHADFFRSSVPGLEVDVTDLEQKSEPLVFIGDFLEFEASRPYDVIWCSHTLEHVRNTGMFLDKIRALLVEDGLVCITVPPHVDDLGILAHLTTWDPMLLIINLVNARFDCRNGRFARYRYNISGIAYRTSFSSSAPIRDLIPKLHKVGHRLSGRFKYLNWERRTIRSQAKLTYPSIEACAESLSGRPEIVSQFLMVGGDDKQSPYYYDARRRWLLKVA